MTTTHILGEQSADLAALIKRVAAAKRFVVITGAGISVRCGIPDFRSADGLFRQIQETHGDLVSSGRDLFDASVVFRSAETADVFYRWMTHLRHQCASAQPGIVHNFIKQLADRGSLLRSYTQNIDGLERKAGLAVWDPYSSSTRPEHVPWQKAQSVPLHGSMEHLTCQLCSSSYHFSELPTAGGISAGDVCLDCQTRSQAREASGRRALPAGRLRPAVVLYEEPHPHCEDIAKIIAHDTRALGSRRAEASMQSASKKMRDVVLIFGTTLKVPGCRQLVKQLALASPTTTTTIFVNNEPVCGKAWDGIIDHQVVGHVEDWCARIERQWNAQTKITQWTRTVKHATALRAANTAEKESSKKRRHESSENSNTAAVADNSKRPRAASSSPGLALTAVPAVQKTQAAKSHSRASYVPIRRSARIAERQSLEHHHSTVAICT
ncbi:NAD-dependent deacetylase hst3 [Dipsacomyces acuminosporus]|nr:NAD-dependent deacetylase hst3 [Dipsacomyces acuminosporus]